MTNQERIIKRRKYATRFGVFMTIGILIASYGFKKIINIDILPITNLFISFAIWYWLAR